MLFISLFEKPKFVIKYKYLDEYTVLSYSENRVYFSYL